MSDITFMYALLGGILPSLIWLIFWTREDKLHPESKTLLALSFCAGMIAVFLALYAENYTLQFLDDISLRYTIWAAIEEIAKFLAVAAVALYSIHNDEPIDAMVYCITVALGFAALENALFIHDPLRDGEVLRSLITGNMRFIGATLVHIVSSASIGFAFGLTFYRRPIVRIFATLVGLGVAIALHSAFNLSIVGANPGEILQVFAWFWGAVVILIVLFEEVKAVRPRYT